MLHTQSDAASLATGEKEFDGQLLHELSVCALYLLSLSVHVYKCVYVRVCVCIFIRIVFV